MQREVKLFFGRGHFKLDCPQLNSQLIFFQTSELEEQSGCFSSFLLLSLKICWGCKCRERSRFFSALKNLWSDFAKPPIRQIWIWLALFFEKSLVGFWQPPNPTNLNLTGFVFVPKCFWRDAALKFKAGIPALEISDLAQLLERLWLH